MNCPCGSIQSYESCCKPFIKGTNYPETAEQLMRSRYTAYTKGLIDYIKETLAPESQKDFHPTKAKKWALESEWLGLKILNATGSKTDKKGTVEFIASYKEGATHYDHHETSQFRKNENGHWRFVSGTSTTDRSKENPTPKIQTQIRESSKIGRNDACPCGSGKKYKKCCGNQV
ncbi:MAG: YchJ family protein [Deltaproteobacteria bacterium]|jgi:SEC-C motif-containing protein|nr:YchJ family protein [Deltaproteobacteria bacterium]